jgi:hypothetical protein
MTPSGDWSIIGALTRAFSAFIEATSKLHGNFTAAFPQHHRPHVMERG